MIKIIAVGKKSEYDSQINNYKKRLIKPFETKFELIDFSSHKDEEARNLESKKIFDLISDNDFVILLDERGVEMDNYELTNTITAHNKVVFIIGGPYGVNPELRKRANILWSIGKLIMPYDIVRLILVEQIYRSQCIKNNHPYHHK
ncbi:MAG: 23S rRNA (pseudouridine(1915)-N(3))-methyltransferase RlmH [Mycoplasmataceae bacterium]|jgi:23S rRNA (pseudouridine1915-N3)-methyltransferase|nr:23S rRNA (pseudouridine(1915)-N(3))-methyltransferase RlmH [Mycoplasmataceae bacterium]